MRVLAEPSPIVQQRSGRDPDGRWVLSVLFKQTYTITSEGACVPAAEQMPLVDVPIEDDADGALLVQDSDCYPYKPCTDVVVQGHAYGYTGRTMFHATVSIVGHTLHVLVVGDRFAWLDAYGRIGFTEPAPVGHVPLRYTHAYGGSDRVTAARYAAVPGRTTQANPFSLSDEAADAASAFRYPRNPCGCGYLVEVTPDAVAQLRLPNLEDPYDPLTPERIVVGDPERWAEMPLPHATDWVGHTWFPRSAYFGMGPTPAASAVPPGEVTRWGAPADIGRIGVPPTDWAFRGTCGSSPALHVPYLRGGEVMYLGSVHPRREQLHVWLPTLQPAIWVDGRQGTFKETEPVIHTVVVEPDLDRLTIVWRGSAPALRMYAPQELDRMPLRVAY